MIEASYPLSSMQQGMLYHSLVAPETGVYVQQHLSTLREALDVEAFVRAWERVVARHDVLRTAFRWQALDEPLQEVYDRVSTPLQVLDWSDMSVEQQHVESEAFLQDDRRRGFTLTAAPLMRLTLIRLATAKYLCIWTYHHSLLDGRSRVVVLRELFALYAALRSGQECPLPPPRPYRAYITWLQQQDLRAAESFWRQVLQGFTGATPLPIGSADRQGAGVHSGHGEQCLRLSPALRTALQDLATTHQLTLNTFVQAAWALVLSRYSGMDDVVFGVTRACRASLAAHPDALVGLFINTLPFRSQVPAGLELRQWLKELRDAQLAVRPYEHSPLMKIQAWTDMPAGAGLFDSLVVFEHAPVFNGIRGGGSDSHMHHFELREHTSYPLTLSAFGAPELILKIEYDQSRFDAPTINRMLRHLQTGLESMAADPEQPVANVGLLTASERHHLLVEWHRTAENMPRDGCIHQLFEAQVERTPEATAYRCDTAQLTYRALNERANQLAHHLRTLGVGPDVPVGICVERSLEMAVGLLGILKAGGAYVPLDPNYPEERLTFMLQDAQVSVLLTQQHLREALPPHHARVTCLDADWMTIAQESRQSLQAGLSTDHLAYVIYTSGSTGHPKGVLISHRGLVNHCIAVATAFSLGADDRVLQFASPSFDIAVEEMFPTWITGGTVVAYPLAPAAPVAEFLEAIEGAQITVLDLPTAFWHELVHAVTLSDAGLPRSLRLVVVGGEKADATAFARWQALGGHRLRWVNSYGPTETTVTATVYEAPEDAGAAQSPTEMPIGRPLANTEVYLLDHHLQPVPLGIAGEIYIAGVGLARGYRNRPAVTAQRFIPHPWSDIPGARLYRSGDMARYRPDGQLEFLGRQDYQVKIQGFRVDVGEVEAIIRQHPGVGEAVVVAQQQGSGPKRLVAYVVPSRQPAPTDEELRRFLRGKLPRYSLPALILYLPALPLSPNGKVDRRALPSPEERSDALTPLAPRDDLEWQLLQVWAEVLHIPSLGVCDNFFDLGGNSLLSMRLLSTLERLTGKRLTSSCLFEAPTIAQLAERLREPERQARSSTLVKIQPHGTRAPFFCVHGAGGGVLWYKDLARLLGTDQPFYGIESSPLEDREDVDRSLEAMASSYLEAIRRVQASGPYMLGGYSMGGVVAFEMACQLQAMGETVGLLAILDAWSPNAHLSTAHKCLRLLSRFIRLERQAKRVFLHDKWTWMKLILREYIVLGIWNSQVRQLRQLKRTNVQASRTYAPRTYHGTLTLFRAQTQHATADADPELGWGQLVTGRIDIHEIPGDHYTMFASPHIDTLAQQLTACLLNCRYHPSPDL